MAGSKTYTEKIGPGILPTEAKQGRDWQERKEGCLWDTEDTYILDLYALIKWDVDVLVGVSVEG